ncbi:class III chitinase [Fomitiporia mediterranea MF3/22]|uniref:class III chitinase n=1 Tax=Fomitiporia mediterranea (strain MF3/22) TaxID=694068 RepID=UPI00044072CC|nr:class III chitinase [Fomitiporia mediterranea MF3/22]EJD04291.1 class III chitinase [Fomitiporia mediterranea MF3/22]
MLASRTPIVQTHSLRLTFVFLVLSITHFAIAFDTTRFDNLAVYWGQNSYGATHPDDPANWQKPLSFYCGDDSTIDAFPVAFLNVFFGTGGLPSINLANTCNPTDNATFPGTQLPDCSALASDIETCQSKGKIITISLGGATGSVGFSSDSQAETFADTVWNLFLGGSSDTRPFGNAVLDGVDLDIEGGGSGSYAAFVNRIRSHAGGASKKYYVTAAPQCPFPDASLGAVLNSAEFDAVYVQFYNNVCGLNNFNLAQDWDFGLWDNWARTMSPNPNAKVYIGAPASSTAAGQGFISADTLSSIAAQTRKSFPSFGGVMLWDASQAVANDRYDAAIKSALTAAGGTGFTFPPCSAPEFVSGTSYTGGSQVSFNGYIWQAKFFASSTPANDPNNEWSAISACAGDAPSGSSSSSSAPSTSAPSSTSTVPSSSTSTPTSTASSPSTSPTSPPSSGGVNCASVQTWTAGVAYTAGEQVVSGGHLWTANWWTEGDVPNSEILLC